MKAQAIPIAAATALALAAGLAVWSANQEPAPRTKREPRAVAQPAITSVQLPGDDGRVHIITTSDGIEVSRCAVHVFAGGSSVSCTQAPDYRPSR